MRLILAITLAACHPASDEVGDLRHPPGDTDSAEGMIHGQVPERSA